MEFTHIHHTSSDFLHDFYANYEPVIILNTGRSGSGFIQTIFKSFHEIEAYHEASPNLFLQSNFAYHNQGKHEVLQKMFEVARVELMLTSKVKNKIFLETNQCLVFYVHQIATIFPRAKFVHLLRHPGEFVRSAVRKGWHKNDSVWELGRIKMDDQVNWEKLSQIEKLSWVWSATHNYIEEFKATIHDRCITMKLEDLVGNYEEFNRLVHFVGVENQLSQEKFIKIAGVRQNQLRIDDNEPDNMHKLDEFPKYGDWNQKDKLSLKNFTLKQSKLYSYNLD